MKKQFNKELFNKEIEDIIRNDGSVVEFALLTEWITIQVLWSCFVMILLQLLMIITITPYYFMIVTAMFALLLYSLANLIILKLEIKVSKAILKSNKE